MILVLPTVCIAQQKAEQTQDKAQQQNDQQGLGLPAQTAGITEARLSAELYVTRIKKTFKESDSDYQKAKDLYDETYAKYGGWVAAVSLAIKAGDAKNLRKDSEYKRIATETHSTNQAFIAFAKDALKRATAVPPAGTGFGMTGGDIPKKTVQEQNADKIAKWKDIGLAIWDAIKKEQIDKRKTLADMFENQVKWRAWEQIGS